MIKSLIYDLDGTLVNSRPGNFISFNRALEEFGLSPISQEAHAKAFAMPARDSLIHFGISEDQVDEALDFWMDLLHHDPAYSHTLFDGIKDLVEEARERGLHQGVITSRRKDSAHRELERLGLAEDLDPVVTVNHVKNPKPHRDSLDCYLDKTGFKEEEVIYLGDSASDSAFALGAGIDFALALWGTSDPDLPASVRLKEPLDLLEYLDMKKD